MVKTISKSDDDYMIPFYRDEISTRPAGTDFTLQETYFRPGKAEQVSIWYFIAWKIFIK